MIATLHAVVAAALGVAVTPERVFVDLIRQDAIPVRAPLARYSVVDAVPALSVCGDDGLATARYRVQVDIVSPVDHGKDQHLAVVMAAVAAMGQTEPESVIDTYAEVVDTETNCYRARIDYLLGFSTIT